MQKLFSFRRIKVFINNYCQLIFVTVRAFMHSLPSNPSERCTDREAAWQSSEYIFWVLSAMVPSLAPLNASTKPVDGQIL